MDNPHPNDDKRFPATLRLANGTLLQRDPSRLLLFLKQPYELRNVESIIANIPAFRGIGLALEGQESGYIGRISEQNAKQINHTDKRFWIKAHEQQRIDQQCIALLESSFARDLERVAGVYSLPAVDGHQALYCPMPYSLIVVKRATADDSALDQILAQFNLEVIRDLSELLGKHTRYCVLKGDALETVFHAHISLYTEYRKLVETVVLDFMPHLSPNAVTPNDEYYAAPIINGRQGQWNMKLIGAENAWNLSKGTNVVVALIDPEGVDTTHPDLSGANQGVRIYFPPNTPSPIFISGQGILPGSHGTQCAGIIAARMNNGPANNKGVAGLACDCSLLPIQTMNATLFELGAGIAYAASTGSAQVISMSFGYSYADVVSLNLAGTLNGIIEDAFTGGVVLVAASGNWNSSTIDYPASHQRVIACGASNGGYADLLKLDYRCQPSLLPGDPLGDPDWGSEGSNYGPQLSVMAPGMNLILTTRAGKGNLHPPVTSDYEKGVTGTSLATPHVAGVAALLFQKYTALVNNPQRVRDIIERTAEKVHNHETHGYFYADDGVHLNGPWCSEMGYGRVNAYRALDYAELLIKDHPGDTGSEPSLALGSAYWDSSDIVIRPVGDTTWDPTDVTIASYVAQGENICYVAVTNNGPAVARNVQVRATIWPRQQAAEVRLRDVSPFGRKIALFPVDNQVDNQGTAITTHIILPSPEVPNVYLEVASIHAGDTQRVQFKLNGLYPLRWARGDADPYYDTAMGHIGPRHILLVVEATAVNDYAYQNAIKSNLDDIVMKRRNVAMRELRFTELNPYP